jgi:UPF0755 protein
MPGGSRDGSWRGSRSRPRAFRPRRWALMLLLMAGVLVFADLFVPAGLFPAHERRVVLVQRGQSLREVARELERVGLLRGTLGFEVLARFMRLDRSIKAGQYSFQLGITVPGLLHAFARGMSGLNLITFPEGLTTSEIAVLLSNRLGVPIAAFDSLAHDRVFLDSLSIAAPSIEGYLAPDSYEFLPGTSPEVAFRTMVQHQRELLLKLSAGRDSLPLGMSLHEVLTLASIVESEAQFKDERARIASVYLNRLEKHMRLQADPTVGYALGIGPRSRLYLRQLHVNSPFNTYLYEGLPPGPICNPGRASIGAVLDPMPGVHDLYFVARGEGRHLFAETYEQHLRNIVKARAMIAAAEREGGESDESVADSIVLHGAASIDSVKQPALLLIAPGTKPTGKHGKHAKSAAPDTTKKSTHAARAKAAPADTTKKSTHAAKAKAAPADSTKHHTHVKHAAADSTAAHAPH